MSILDDLGLRSPGGCVKGGPAPSIVNVNIWALKTVIARLSPPRTVFAKPRIRAAIREASP